MPASAAAGQTLPAIDKLWDYDHPAATEARFRDVLPLATRPGEERYRLELLTQIARTLGLQRKFDDAHRLLDQVEAALRPGMDRVRVRYLLERGRAFNSSGKKAEAKVSFVEAWDLARKAGEDALAVDAAHMAAIAVMTDPTEAMKWNLEALAYAEASKDPSARGWLGSLYNNIGWTYHDKGEFANALAMFEKGLAWRVEKTEVSPIRIARWSVARALRSLGRFDEALDIQRNLEKEFAEAGETDGYVFEEIGELLTAKAKPAEAAPYFAKAHAELSRDAWLAENEPKRLARLAELAMPRHW